MFKPTYLLGLSALIIFPSCGLGGGDEDYDTSDPYGVPDAGGYESAPYQDVNPPASNPTYGSAAYEETAPATATPTAPTPPPAVASTHTVAKGDTLWGLSRKYNVTVDAIRAANGMAADDNNVRLGQTINIPAP
ncbi:LysM peptidoglycan-binding domain-containing protein [Haloferula rosea]|uniref:LysM peptidoglycan-binding domain-containing protein n=1 Tax=Haloferula rosea TaxID=490093 RepID=A0A934RDD2_9BACT|nr:LysM domain-containing protein [Haloferula rosea]MBK1826991.1 LysM peptidoglycan-binding domain-containing protein [Haloferula rosea]